MAEDAEYLGFAYPASARVAPAGDTARQFVIERIPDFIRPHPGFREPATPLPLTVWVDPKPVSAIDYGCPNCAVIYRVIPEAMVEWRTVTKISARLVDCFVCPCMGHFIE